MISNEEKKFIDNLLSNEKIREFVSEHDLTYDQILLILESLFTFLKMKILI